MKKKIQITTPQLALEWNRKRWLLMCEIVDGRHEGLFTLKIEHAWNGYTWDRYEFFRCLDGVEFQYVTPEAWEQQYEAIEQNEGKDAAEAWVDRGDVRIEEWPYVEVFNELKNRYEAMTTHLGLFQLNINI